MTVLGRRVRLGAAIVVFGLLVLGTWRGDDDNFPFGPFRMYASRQSLDAPTAWLVLQADTGDGRTVLVDPSDSGLRRAELEGQLGQILAQPARLAVVATSYARHHPGEPPLVAVELVRRSQPMRHGEPLGGTSDEVVARWDRS